MKPIKIIKPHALICTDCDSFQCEEPKRVTDARYRGPVRGDCSFCHDKDRALVKCTCDLTPCPDGCGCAMQLHRWGARTGILLCRSTKCIDFRHTSVMAPEPQETQVRPLKSDPEMIFDAIEPEDLPMDQKSRAAGER